MIDAMWDSWLNGSNASAENIKLVNELDKCEVVPIMVDEDEEAFVLLHEDD